VSFAFRYKLHSRTVFAAFSYTWHILICQRHMMVYHKIFFVEVIPSHKYASYV
jgi:hypothetical protein